MSRALITGAHGFVGPYLARHLRTLGREVWGTSTDEASHADFETVRLDVRDRERVMQTMADVAPDEVYHLAALSRPTLVDAGAYYDVNLHGTRHVLEAATAISARVLVVSSAYVYGARSGLLGEDTPLRPMNDYGASKAAAEMAAVAATAKGLHAVRVRPFNHTGPGQPPAFFVPALLQQIAAIRAGTIEAIVRLGDLAPIRDLSDVRDVVRTYPLLLEHGASGEAYNVGTCIGTSMRQVVQVACSLIDRDVEIATDPSRLRASDVPQLVADVQRLHATIDWRPEVALAQTLRDMLDTSGPERSP